MIHTLSTTHMKFKLYLYGNKLTNTQKWVFYFDMFEFLSCYSELNIIYVQYMCLSSVKGSSVGSVDRLCDLCDYLYGTLADADMLNRHCKRRSGILRTLFRLIDLNFAQLNLLIAKLCLAVSLQVYVWVCECVCMSLSQTSRQLM